MVTHASGSVKEDVVSFNLCGTDRLRLGRTSQYQHKQNIDLTRL